MNKEYHITTVREGKLHHQSIQSDEIKLMSIMGNKTISELMECDGFLDYFTKFMEWYENTNENTNENPSLEWIIESWMVKSREDKLNSLLDDK